MCEYQGQESLVRDVRPVYVGKYVHIAPADGNRTFVTTAFGLGATPEMGFVYIYG
jgi:hypothetical protein